MEKDGNAVLLHHRPTLNEKIFFLISGIIVSVPLTLFADSLSNQLFLPLTPFYATFFSVVVSTPLIEEFAKAFPLFYRHGETVKSLFTLGFIVGLGFGISEFFLYVVVLGVPVIDRLPGILFHAASTSITSYGIATGRPIVYYLIAVALHFMTNFFALYNSVFFIVTPMGLAVTYYLSYYIYRKTTEIPVYG